MIIARKSSSGSDFAARLRRLSRAVPGNVLVMKHAVVFLLLAATLTGCTRHYVVTLTNGTRITTRGKPQLQDGRYVFKDARGQSGFVSAARVREIAPASMAGSPSSSRFKATPKK